MDVRDWLRSLGLEQYEAPFRDNAIDYAILPSLTSEDLKDLGVDIVGHRRKLLNAIAALQTDASAKTSPPDAPATVERPPADAAERRQITVLFSDLVGSTALSGRMDPEDLREVISAYQACVAETVRRFDGFVAKYMGDGVLVYFGYPQAHEDDAERAVRAALELIGAVNGLKSSVPLQARIGVATGLVVVGDLVGSGEAQERGIVGETPNLAARLQGIADPNTVVIAESTRRLLGNLFELKDLGAKELKGITGTVRAWVPLRISSVESRFEALHATVLTELIGREEQLEMLLRRWSRAKTGEGQVVLLTGEAGIGKSRLTAALLERLSGEPHTRLRYFCSPQYTDSALYPIIGQMQRAAGLAQDDTPQTKCDKLDAVLTQSSTSAADAALFAEMLSLSNDGRYPALPPDPQLRRQKTLEALVAQIGTLAHSHPVLMIFEDAHWIDPTSLEVLDLVVQRAATLAVLLIVTYRPEFMPPWTGRPHVTSLTINRLARRDVDAVIDRIVGNKVLPADIRQEIIERTDGIPLFVEEMTKAVLEAEDEGEAKRTAANVASLALAVPATLHASLMARLDRLGPAKEIAQVGAAIGREFSHPLLASVVSRPEMELEPALDRLVSAGLLFRQGVSPHATYLFKHALVQDAAYGTLLREPRRALHARIAEALENQFPEIAENQPELLARHCVEAGLIEKAASLWGKAGQRSVARSALVEAATQFRRALDQIATLPATSTLRREQIELQVKLVNALMHVKGYAAPETKAAEEKASLLIEQAEAIGESPEDPLLFFSVLYGAWSASYVAFNGDEVLSIASKFLTLAERQQATAPLIVGNRMMGTSLLLTGDIARSRVHFDRAMSLYNPAEHRPLATRFGQDVQVSILIYRSMALWLLGKPNSALANASEATECARFINQAATLMYALVHASFSDIIFGRYTEAHAKAAEALALASEKSAMFWKSFSTLLQGCALARTDNHSDAARMLTAGIPAARLTGATLWMPVWLSHLAMAYAKLGKVDEASRSISEALAAIETTNERLWEAEIYRIAGEILLQCPDSDAAKAEAHFQHGLAVARKQEAKSWELRVALSMARLWREQGKRSEARDLLAPIYGWFAAGLDTLDLKQARALLDELAS